MSEYVVQIDVDLPKKYLTFPLQKKKISGIKKLGHALIGLVLSPIYWGMAYLRQTPGLAFRCLCMLKGLQLLLKERDFIRAYDLIVSPLDSVRYFEFDFMWRTIKRIKILSYLDVSSPRLLPLMIAARVNELVANLINPDKNDMALTISLAKSFGVAVRCRFHECLIEKSSLEPNLFDLITSMSVIEHIPDDKGAIQKMWDLLKPGGILMISIPCAAKAWEEYININDYALLDSDESGFVFWQRYYDEELIRQHIFSITGEPNRYRIYGEKQANSYHWNVIQKRTDPFYPSWREPFMMGLHYEFKNKISELPGMGVIAMEFVKPN